MDSDEKKYRNRNDCVIKPCSSTYIYVVMEGIFCLEKFLFRFISFNENLSPFLEFQYFQIPRNLNIKHLNTHNNNISLLLRLFLQ